MEQKSLLDQMLQFIKDRRLRRRWQQTVTAMAAVVVFATTICLFCRPLQWSIRLLN